MVPRQAGAAVDGQPEASRCLNALPEIPEIPEIGAPGAPAEFPVFPVFPVVIQNRGSHGQFVVAPPSRGTNSNYRFIEGSLDDLDCLPVLRGMEIPISPLSTRQERMKASQRAIATTRCGGTVCSRPIIVMTSTPFST